jgi:hypothetical protein
MNKLFCLLMIVAAIGGARPSARAQTYGNEWIDFGTTYYKFKSGAEGVIRITSATLSAAGLTNLTGSDIAVYRDGSEVPLFVSTNGLFGSGDYIELYAAPMDGFADLPLFSNPAWQANKYLSLFSDSSSYFLVSLPGAAHARYVDATTAIPSGISPLANCMFATGIYPRNRYMEGLHIVDKQPVFSSMFDQGEGFVDSLYLSSVASTYSLQTDNAIGGAVARLEATVLRLNYETTPSQIPVKLYLNGTEVADSTMVRDDTKHFDLSFSSSLLQPSASLTISPSTTTIDLDVYGLALARLTYPRNFDVAGLNRFVFSLSPSGGGQLIEFSNFNVTGGAPRLYDVTNKRYYVGDISIAGKSRFYIDPSLSERKLVLIAAGTSVAVGGLKSINFTNYADGANQGKFIIISHHGYENPANGANQVAAYAAYRASPAGGGYTVVTAFTEDLCDQFAYGVALHPLGIKRFLQYGYNQWAVKPEDVFLLGKGIYYPVYQEYLQNPSQIAISGVVPTFGYPGSDMDFVNFLLGRKAAINIGRLSAWNPAEIAVYLQKVKAYEANLNSQGAATAGQAYWQKQILHIAGGRYAAEQQVLLSALNNGKAVIEDTSFGAAVTTVAKNTTVPVDFVASAKVDSLINSGLSFITYHGHASSSSFEFNLNSPDQYNSAPRQPHFLAMGCDVAQIFSLNANKTISERYVEAVTGGAMSMIASDNLQYSSFYNTWLPAFYRSVSKRNYGAPLGRHLRYAYDTIITNDQTAFTYFQLESMMIQGDPALRVPGQPLPDYHIAASGMASLPGNVTTAEDSFTLRIVAYNLGRATNDTVGLQIKHRNPAGTEAVVASLRVASLLNIDTLLVRIAVAKNADLGLNRYTATLDAANEYDEVSETNNEATLDLFIYADNLVPVFPPPFSIVGQQGVTLKASTLNAFKGMGRYKMELDTTELFNSSLKQSTLINSAGGVLTWTPNLALNNNTVYYWRTAVDSLQNGIYQWGNSSFIYLAGSSPGWNQSHYYQYLKDDIDSLVYGPDRVFAFPTASTKLVVSNVVFSATGATPWDSPEFGKVVVNDADVQRAGCPPWGGTLQVMVFDSLTNALWKNDLNGTAGAYPQCLSTRNVYAFEFPVYTKQGRDDARAFIDDSIPAGNFVLLRNLINNDAYIPTYLDAWKADTVINGPGQSLYHTIYNLGFTAIDSFTGRRPFFFLRKKGSSAFPVYQQIATDSLQRIEQTYFLPATRSSGVITSVVIGPAKTWNRVIWQTSSRDGKPQNDMPYLSIAGVDSNGQKATLYTGLSRDTSLSFIDAARYPRLVLTWRSRDTISFSSPQLDFWRVLYEQVPEAALNPRKQLTYTDSAAAGQTIQFSTAIENIGELPMDSMLVRYKLIDASGITHELGSRRYKPLAAGDTLNTGFSYDATNYPGLNTFFIEANPNNDQPELYHPNNLGYLPLYISSDLKNPLIDVTFDGVHILNRDIVSAKPFIKITLKDENRYQALNDTALLKVFIRYPEDAPSTRRPVPFDGTTCKFLPASTLSGRNEASIEYTPTLTQDGIYDLYVNGRDKSGNVAAASDYQVAFEVVNKSSITHVLNYPNPFSTSTAFVFTLTGSVTPSQFKIQIISVTGKVVKEITRQELGPIRIGRNVTEYKWDGRDQYGQLLGNGVYLYRVVTAINGEGIEHRSDMDGNASVNTVDKYFKNGWGKMYIMR